MVRFGAFRREYGDAKVPNEKYLFLTLAAKKTFQVLTRDKNKKQEVPLAQSRRHGMVFTQFEYSTGEGRRRRRVWEAWELLVCICLWQGHHKSRRVLQISFPTPGVPPYLFFTK